MSRRSLLAAAGALILFGVVGSGPAPAQEPGQEPAPAPAPTAAVAPPDVYRLSLIVRDDIERIRRHVDGATDPRGPIEVSRAQPHEVYFQARGLLRKVDQYAFEQTRRIVPKSSIPDRALLPADVLGVLVDTRERLSGIGAKLGVQLSELAPPRDDAMTPTDVFRSLSLANRQMNLLLERPAAPGDVYQEVSQALAYALALRTNFPDARPPVTPAKEPGRLPGDVHRRLVECLGVVQRVAGQSGLDCAEFTEESTSVLQPNDVYDVGSLLLAELHRMHGRSGLPPPISVPFPGRREPSDVFQRAGMLRAVLLELEPLTAARPDWLRRVPSERD